MLDAKAFPLSFSITISVVYLVCALAFYLFPALSLEFFNTWFHGVDLSKIPAQGQRSATGFFAGLIGAFVFSYLSALLWAVFYNLFAKNSKA